MKIYAPVKEANGVYASVRFVNGVGETDDPKLIKWFQDRGYTIEKCDISSPKVPEKCEIIDTIEEIEVVEEDEMMGYADATPNFDTMTPYQLREWMLRHGYNVRNARSKEKLLEILRG